MEAFEQNKIEIDLKFDVITNELGHIKEQTTKTNGRVNKLEDKTADLEKKDSGRSGMWMVVKVVAGSIVAICMALIAFMQYLKP